MPAPYDIRSETIPASYPLAAAAPPSDFLRPARSLPTIEAGPAPYVISHRGCPDVFPEETMDAYRAVVNLGGDFIEADCYLLADNSIGIMHDDTLDRTTTATGNVADQTVFSWRNLVVDASSFLGGGWADTKAPMLNDLIAEFGNRVILCLEPKGTGAGAPVVQALLRYGIRKDMVLINSYQATELLPAIAAGYPTCLNIAGAYTGTPTPAALLAAGYGYAAPDTSTAKAQLDALRAAGLKVMVSDASGFPTFASIASFLGHVDAIYSNNALYLKGLTRSKRDPYAGQTWWHGQIATNANGENAGRGAFFAPNMWGYNLASANTFAGALQGWASPIGGGATLPSATINFTVKFESAFATDRFAWIVLSDRDTVAGPLDSDFSWSGYNFVVRKNGSLNINRYTKNVEAAVQVAAAAGTTIADGGSANYRATVTPTTLKLENLTQGTSCTATDATTRGPYLHAGVKGIFGKFSNWTISVP